MLHPTFKIDFDNVICKDFMGLNAIYHPFAYDKEFLQYGDLEEQAEQEMSVVRQFKPSVLRGIFDTSAAVENSITEEADLSCDYIESRRRFYQKLKDNNLTAAIQAGWGFPYCIFKGKEDMENYPTSVIIESFAENFARIMDYYLNECKLDNIKYVMLFTEPTTTDDRYLPKEYSNNWDFYVDVCRSINEKLVEYKVRDMVQLVGPNNSERGRHLDKAVRDLNDIIDIYSGHFYNYVYHWEWKSMCEDFTDIVAPTGKPFWLDEYGTQLEVFKQTPQHGNYIAVVACASINAGHQTSMMWTMLDQKFPGLGEFPNIDCFHNGYHVHGVFRREYETNTPPGKPYPSYYAYKLLASAFNEENTSTVKASDRFTTWHNATRYSCFACAAKSGEDITIAAINSTNCDFDILIDSNGGNRTLYRYIFDPWSDDEAYETRKPPVMVEMKDGKINDCLPKGAFFIYRSKEIEFVD